MLSLLAWPKVITLSGFYCSTLWALWAEVMAKKRVFLYLLPTDLTTQIYTVESIKTSFLNQSTIKQHSTKENLINLNVKHGGRVDGDSGGFLEVLGKFHLVAGLDLKR
jgi:hypothetical protein